MELTMRGCKMAETYKVDAGRAGGWRSQLLGCGGAMATRNPLGIR